MVKDKRFRKLHHIELEIEKISDLRKLVEILVHIFSLDSEVPIIEVSNGELLVILQILRIKAQKMK